MKKIHPNKILAWLGIFSFGVFFAFFWGLRNPVILPQKQTKVTIESNSKILLEHVKFLSTLSPSRSVHHPKSLAQAVAYIKKQMVLMGYQPTSQGYKVDANTSCENIRVLVGNKKAPRIVIGAHYDSAHKNNPGANDNASGVAGLLELLRMFSKHPYQGKYALEFVAYSTEEPPWFATEHMGSSVHAHSLKKEGIQVKAMVSIEMIGYFTEAPSTQTYPHPLFRMFYPTTGNFVAVVGDQSLRGRALTKHFKSFMASTQKIPVWSLNAPAIVSGVDFSDHRSYWGVGFPAVMVTDTSFFRYEHYHQPTDTYEKLDYKRMKYVVEALFVAIQNL